MKINSTISDRVFSHLASIRKQKEDKLFNLEQFLSSDKEYDFLTRKINNLNFLIGKNKSNNLDTTDLEKSKQDVQEKLSNRLTILNVKPSDLELNYNCDLCKDKGYFNGKYCKCFYKFYNKFFLNELGISYKKLPSFSDSKISSDNELSLLHNKFLDYCNNFSLKSLSYVFYGKCGTGKTFLAECIAQKLRDKYEVLYLNSFELNNLFIKYHTAPLTEKNFYFSSFTNSDLIIIDDLGTEPIYNKVTLEYLYLLFSERLKNNKPFIITTNLSPQEILSRYGERIFVRIFQNKNPEPCIEFPDNNLRKL